VADARWKVGTLTVPAAGGSVSVTGLGGTPKAVFFYGSNWLTEDAGVTSTGTALFRGMAAGRYDSPATIVQSAASFAPAGDCHRMDSSAILCVNTGGGAAVLYRADLTSFDVGGFTLNFTTGAAGGYKVVYIALLGVDHAAAFLGAVSQAGLVLGFKAGAMLCHGAWAGPVISGTDRTQEWFGGAAYPGTNTSAYFGAGLSAQTFPTSQSGQYVNEINNFAPHILVTTMQHFTGPFLTTSNLTSVPTGTGLLNLTFQGDSANGGMVVAWEDENSRTGRVTPPASVGGQTTISLPFKPGLVIGYTISNEPSGQGTGSRGAGGFGVASKTFQWAGVIDGVSSRGSFQSFARGFADAISGTAVHAGTVELLSNGFRLTTTEAGITPSSWVWHAFGEVRPGIWLPSVYRRVVTT
jgi:hypothetical protein